MQLLWPKIRGNQLCLPAQLICGHTHTRTHTPKRKTFDTETSLSQANKVPHKQV